MRPRNRLRRFGGRHRTWRSWQRPYMRNPDDVVDEVEIEDDIVEAPVASRYRRHNPQAPVWQKPLWNDDSAVWRGPLFKNPDEEVAEVDEVDVVPITPAQRRMRRFNPQPPVWQKPLWNDDSAVWRGPLFRNPQPPVWQKPLWNDDSAVWRGPLFRNPEDAIEIDEEIVAPARRRMRRFNPQPPVWQKPLWNDDSAVWRGPLFRNPDEDRCEICNLRKNPQAPVWNKPLWTEDSPVWRGPLFRRK